jgi:hypothetical protein
MKQWRIVSLLLLLLIIAGGTWLWWKKDESRRTGSNPTDRLDSCLHVLYLLSLKTTNSITGL